jgi:hypothetical protein
LENFKIHGSRWSLISSFLPGVNSKQVKNFYYSNLRKKIRKITKELIKKDEKELISNSQLRKNSKLICEKIYNKIFQRKINYFQLNEEIIKGIIEERENEKTQEKTLRSSNSIKILFSPQKIKSENSNIDNIISHYKKKINIRFYDPLSTKIIHLMDYLQKKKKN